MYEFEILARGVYRPEQLSISYDPALSMPKTPAIQEWMDTLWEQRLAEAKVNQIPLYDSKLYRLVSAESRADDQLHLVLGPTGYKEYVTTREPTFAEPRNRQELGNALSVCSVIETSDGQILLDKRQGVDVYVGRYHVIGGFFERNLDTHQPGFEIPDPFGGISREIREETGIGETDIAEQLCLGVVYDVATPHAEICFLTRLSISEAEVRTRQPEDQEIGQLLTLPADAASLRAFILDNHGQISATGEPNLLMYGGLRFGEPWFEELMRELSPDDSVTGPKSPPQA